MQVTNPVQAIWWLADGQQAGHSERDRHADLHRTFPLRQDRADPVLCDVVGLGAVGTAVRRDGGTGFGARQARQLGGLLHGIHGRRLVVGLLAHPRLLEAPKEKTSCRRNHKVGHRRSRRHTKCGKGTGCQDLSTEGTTLHNRGSWLY